MIRLTSFVGLLIILVACNAQEDRILRPTPIPALRSPVAASVSGNGVITVGKDVRRTFMGNPVTYQLIAPSNGTSGPYELVASHSRKCLDVNGWSTDDGTPLIQLDCHGGDNQVWSLEATGDGYSRIISRHSGKCLDVSGGSTDDGASIIQWQCHGGANQKWLLPPVTTAPPPPPQREDDYTGVYTLIITAGFCSPGFPEEAKRRVYTAQVEQTGADLRVSLSGADFVRGAFAGAVTPTGEISFGIGPTSIWDYGVNQLEERLSDGTVLVIFGTIAASSTPAGISGKALDQDAGLGGIFRKRLDGVLDLESHCEIGHFEMVPR
jgi:hypothetical protein